MQCDSKRPQFRILSDRHIAEIHNATLQILERGGAAFEAKEALDILGEAGLDVSNPARVKMPTHMVEEAIRKAPKIVTTYSREGAPAIILNGLTGAHFGSIPDLPTYRDPYMKRERTCYIEDIVDTARVIDALPNVEWVLLGTVLFTFRGLVRLIRDVYLVVRSKPL